MRIEEHVAARLKELGTEIRQRVSLAEQTSLGIGGTTDELLLRRYETIPEVMRVLANENIRHKFLGGGTNVLVADGELPWVALHLPSTQPGMRVEGNMAYVDASADLGGMVTFCAKRDLGGMEGLIGVPGSVGGALRMNAGAYGTQIGRAGDASRQRHSFRLPAHVVCAGRRDVARETRTALEAIQGDSGRDSRVQRKTAR
jgi:FAD binding domain